MLICKYFTYFVIFSCMGWIYETIYCTVKTKKWDNRGFLFGPVCPIYGVGGVLITIIAELAVQYGQGKELVWWQVFLISFFGSIVLEYVTSWTLEKVFHAYWWDYSNRPFNINGRVCLPCSIGFGCAGLLVVYVIAPFTRNMTEWISPPGYEALGLIFMGMMSADTALTVAALTDFEDSVVAAEKALNQYMDDVVDDIVDTVEERKQERAAAIAEVKEGLALAPKGRRKERISSMGDPDIQKLMLESFGMLKSGSKAATRRVEGFRQPRRAQQKHMDLGLELLKSRRK